MNISRISSQLVAGVWGAKIAHWEGPCLAHSLAQSWKQETAELTKIKSQVFYDQSQSIFFSKNLGGPWKEERKFSVYKDQLPNYLNSKGKSKSSK